MRHTSAQRARWGAVLGGALAIACSPLEGDHLRTESVDAAPVDGVVHLVVRIDAESLRQAERIALTASVPAAGADALAILPDEPAHAGASVGRGEALRIEADLAVTDALRAGCAEDGFCEAGLSVIVTPRDGGAAPAVALVLDARTAPEGRFPATASVELEVDGEAAIAARRTP